MSKPSGKPRKVLTGTIHLANSEANELQPKVALYIVDRSFKLIHMATVGEVGAFEIPTDTMQSAHRILVGPVTEDFDNLEREKLLTLRPTDFNQLIERGQLNIARTLWQTWLSFITCVSGTVKRCRRHPSWWYELVQHVRTPLTARALSPINVGRTQLSLRERSPLATLASTSVSELLLWPYQCAIVCKGTVEVYRRTCCCEPWIIDDPRWPELIRDLEDIVREIPEIRWPPRPFPPDPEPWIDLPFVKSGALDEFSLNASRDLMALRSLPKTEVVDYINARPYLLCRRYSCGTPVKVGEGRINPDGRFNVCWRDWPRLYLPHCHDAYAYVVKQIINGVEVVIYDGVAANQWHDVHDNPTLVSYHPQAVACRDNGGPGAGAFVYLDLIGDTGAHNLKTPNSTGWDRVAMPAYNDGLAFPAANALDAVGKNKDRNWGGTLKLSYMFSEDMRGVGAKYYRISVTRADNNGNPVGSRHYLSAGLSWNKSESTPTGVEIIPVTMGPFSQGGQDFLYLIPYDAEEDWSDGFYHAYLDTTQAQWSGPVNLTDPTRRHLVTLEVFDAAGHLLRPQGTAATGQGFTEHEAAFTYRRRYQATGATAEVPFAALTHLFWWDNRRIEADIVDLRHNGVISTQECQFMETCGPSAGSNTFGIGYRAYHPYEPFQLYHQIWWQRGLNGATDYLPPDPPPPAPPAPDFITGNVGLPVPPGTPPGPSPTATFSHMLGYGATTPHVRCTFTVFLYAYAKTTDGESLSNPYDWESASFALGAEPICPEEA